MTEAILLVGGQGTRLRPLTERVPKPLLPVAGVPFLHHQLARLRDAGVEHVVMATSYLAETFDCLGDGSAFGLRLEFVTEEVPLGTGGALRHVVDRLESGPEKPVVVLNGDILSGHDLAGQVADHVERNADVTLHLVRVEDPRAFGCVPTDGDDRVTAFLEKAPEPVTDQVNAGCYVFRRSLLDTIPAGRVVSVERETFPGLLEAGADVRAWVQDAYWLDLGTPASLVQGSADLVRGVLASSALPGDPGEAIVLSGAHVAADAQLTGGTVIGAGASVGAGAVVRGSVVDRDAVLEPGCKVSHSVVGARAVIGAGAQVHASVVGHDATVRGGTILLETRLACGDTSALAFQ